jgi:arylsulfatase A-like enzyme
VRILYVDIDTLRADHLGCYGYHRNTSPNIDALAADGVVFEQVYASDTPCLPSRSALLTMQFGIHNGVVNHGGTDAEPVIQGVGREFQSRLHYTSFPRRLQMAGYRTVSVSSFAQRHSAFHWYAGFSEAYDPGKFGFETADEVHAIAADWLGRRGREDNWFLHVHLWDPHTPYRAPLAYGEPFADAALPAWLTEDVRATHWSLPGPHSAQEVTGFAPNETWARQFPRQPQQMDSAAAVRRMFDGYDTGVRYADDYVGRMLDQLNDLGIADDTAVIVSSDHGETLGELAIYCDHHTADEFTSHVPMIVVWPGLASGRRRGLHYQFDVFASLLELAGGKPSRVWDAESFAPALRAGTAAGREHLILSHCAWTCQRAVRFDDQLYLRTYHDGFHGLPQTLLFDLATDPHEQHDRAGSDPAQTARAAAFLADWHAAMMPGAARGRDPLRNTIDEGGPYHVRGRLAPYLDRLRATGRAEHAARLEQTFAAPLAAIDPN